MNRPLLVLAAVLGSALCASASAQVFTDTAFDALYRARRHAELERQALARVAARADDAQAVLALALVAQQPKGSAAQRQAAIGHAETCVQRQPQSAECHYALGSTLGVHALYEGLLKMAGSVGRVRGELAESLQLAPAWFPARSALVNFYLMAPGLLGGSRDKAVELARAAPAADAQQVLQAMVALHDEKPDAALQSLMAARGGRDGAVDDDLHETATNAAFGLLNAGQPTKARPWFERAVRERPDDARSLFGMGRTLAESGAPADALTWYERAARLENAELLPLDYRIGLAQLALGRNAEAKAALTRFVGAGKGSKKALDDARQKLAQLG